MKNILLFLFVIPVSASVGQSIPTGPLSIKDTVKLDEVVKIESAPLNSDASPFTDVKYREGERISDALKEYSSVYVKNYGSGGLASLAIEGTSAEQTTIEWNGIKLNSISLGQVDLALLMLGMQDNLQLVRTGFEGTIGGTLQMNNEVKRDSGFSIGATFRVGSFGTYEGAANADYAKDKFSGETKFCFLSAQNNFPYINTYEAGNPTVKQTNAQVEQFSALQQFNARINANNQLSFSGWFTDANRQIPPIISQPYDAQRQYDYSIRTMASWLGTFKRLKLKATTAFLDDWMRYVDPNATLNETYLTDALRNNFDCTYTFPFNLVWKSELNYDHEWANISGSVKTRDILGLKSYAHYYFLNGFKIHGGFREDLIDKHLSAFAPELAFNFTGKILTNNRYTLGVVASRNFRFPTFNDLYWLPGGNSDLKEEVSWNGTIQAKYAYKKVIDVSLSNFYIYVSNWIQWMPEQGSNNWEAENFRRVFSRGMEASLHLSNADETRPDKFAVHFTASYTYTKATNLDAFAAYDASKGAQMIYTPYHNAVAGIQFEYKRFYLRSINNYTGLVYTSTDNSQSLPGYFTSNMEVGKDFVVKRLSIGASFKVNNIANQQYQVVAQRPMPGRNFEGTIRFKFTG